MTQSQVSLFTDFHSRDGSTYIKNGLSCRNIFNEYFQKPVFSISCSGKDIFNILTCLDGGLVGHGGGLGLPALALSTVNGPGQRV